MAKQRYSFLLLTLLLILTLTTTASATHPTLSGRFFGLVVQNGTDLDSNGSNGRSGNLPVVESWAFAHAGVNVDTTFTDPFDPQGSCPVGAFELTPSGQLALTSHSGNHVLFAEVDSSATICFDGMTSEVVILDVTGGRGLFEGVTGWIEATLPGDVVLSTDAAGFPEVVYTDGTFEAFLDW